jgi:hypothetical protein
MIFRDDGSSSTVFRTLVAIGVAASLVGCEQTREAFGLKKSAPDEFAVVTRAPLAIPPDYGLRPPTPGVQRPQERTTANEAQNILLQKAGGKTTDATEGATLSRGEIALLGKAGAQNADPSIRDKVARESAVLAESDEKFLAKLIFWQEKEPPGVVVDPASESRRLRENSALGDTPVKGTTPVIKRKQKGFLEGLFN